MVLMEKIRQNPPIVNPSTQSNFALLGKTQFQIFIINTLKIKKYIINKYTLYRIILLK